MTTPPKQKATEERLVEIRRAAAENAGKPAASSSPAGSDQRQSGESYYGLPVLKAPTWTWEVPLYFFFGGISGVSACIGFVAQIFGSNPALIHASLWTALIGAAICPVLLISDLGRPARFLNMLRVFKIRSAMSVGVWILVTFSGCAFLSVLSFELIVRGFNNTFLLWLLWLGETSAAVTGLLLASYTGVLIGATAIPVWSEHRRLIPVHFLTSGLGCSAGILELAGFLIPATQTLGYVAAGIETGIGALLEVRKEAVDGPLHHGQSGWAMRIGGTLEGPVALLVRLIWSSAPAGRFAAAACFLIGALISRYAWIWAGRASAYDPHALFELQRKKCEASAPAFSRYCARASDRFAS
ncbi:MAG: NrfD/PsrC family molybdoenzyme membrane anchor subunit [Candidatus Acidiferrales bacterium]